MFKPVFISLYKNIILIVMVVISVISFWNGMLRWTDLLALQVILGAVYIFLNCYEFLNAAYKAELPVKRFGYFPYSFYMFKIIKASFFTSFAIMLITSGTRVKFLYPICIVIALTELLVMMLKHQRRLNFISLYANYLLFSQNILFKVFANDISHVEFRHDIFYVVQKNKKSYDIRLVNIENKEEFMSAFTEWIKKNNIHVSDESKVKLEKYDRNFV
ncbi:MAG: hypothetical protein ACK50A_11135 [Sphingobacteriaceae bacterium]